MTGRSVFGEPLRSSSGSSRSIAPPEGPRDPCPLPIDATAGDPPPPSRRSPPAGVPRSATATTPPATSARRRPPNPRASMNMFSCVTVGVHHRHDQPLSGAEAEQVAEAMRAFGSATRLRLLWSLLDGERTVEELVGAVGLEQSTVSHQPSSAEGRRASCRAGAGNPRPHRRSADRRLRRPGQRRAAVRPDPQRRRRRDLRRGETQTVLVPPIL
jgi:hypothetical protein